MTKEDIILTKLDKLATDFARFRQQQKKEERWVSASWIQELTGWEENKLQLARRQNIVTWRRKGKAGVEYLLSSVPEEFKKKTV